MKNRTILPVAFFHLVCVVALVGSTSFQVAGNVKQGRIQRMHGDPKVALSYCHVATILPRKMAGMIDSVSAALL
jgi:hypothetical protein